MKILVIDDEKPALRRLTESVQKVVPDAEIYPFSDADEYFAYEPKIGFDAAFLDIELGEISGIELALEIKKHSPMCNIIFVTSHSKYGAEAFSARPSGFIVKPFTEEELRTELDNLRYPLSESKKQEQKIRVLTFGNFVVYKNDNEILNFSRTLSKEVFAYLIDQCGYPVTSRDIALNVLEEPEYNKQVSKNISKIISYLINDLEDAGFKDVVIKQNRCIQINKRRVSCDLYDALSGDVNAVNSFRGEYMIDYSWAEISDAAKRLRE